MTNKQLKSKTAQELKDSLESLKLNWIKLEKRTLNLIQEIDEVEKQ